MQNLITYECINISICCFSIINTKVNCTNIYRKLDVKRREQAVSRAQELNILK